MIIAIDESGDSGKKFWRGSSRWFVLAAIVVDGDIARDQVHRAITTFYKTKHIQEELHFAHNQPQLRRDFMAAMMPQSFSYVCIAINKLQLVKRNPWLFRSRVQLYNYAFGELFDRMRYQFDHPTLLIDRNGGHWFTRSINRYIYTHYGSRHKGDNHAIGSIITEDSINQPLIQLADYVAGAAHHTVQNFSDAGEYREFLHAKGTIFYV